MKPSFNYLKHVQEAQNNYRYYEKYVILTVKLTK